MDIKTVAEAAIARKGDVVFIEQTEPSTHHARALWRAELEGVETVAGICIVLLPFGLKVCKIEESSAVDPLPLPGRVRPCGCSSADPCPAEQCAAGRGCPCHDPMSKEQQEEREAARLIEDAS